VKIDSQIDALYQAPLEQFTAKRNALAKELSGTAKKHVQFLTKPLLPIWAVNQLYWHDRPTYNALLDASEKLRAAHRSALSGRKTDVRKPEQIYRAALERAVAKAVELLERSQGRTSDAARETVRTALAALPTDEAPGRLTRTPEAAGFSLFAGVKPRASTPERPAARAPEKSEAAPGRADAAEATAARARQEHAKRAREKELAVAEQGLRRSRKAAEQARFRVRKLTVELQEAQAAQAKLEDEVSEAEQRLTRLRGRI
jgi:hypothetical protein